MPNTKISGLSSVTGGQVSSSIDVFPIVATATTTTKKITVQGLYDALSTLVTVTSANVSQADAVILYSVSTSATKQLTVATLRSAVSDLQQNSQSAAYTTVAADANKHLLHPTADNNARTFTIDSNANVAYTIGTTITFVNQINTLTIAITTDTMTLAGAGTTGSRTLAANGIATALKVSTTGWVISGTGLT